MLRAYKVFLATAYPQRELVGTMKRLIACLALCASLSASAQDVYPYNPDIEPDGYIGINDLLALLPIFGQEFEVVTVDSVTSSALVFTGSLPYLQCRQSCKSLGPSWNVADEEDVVLHLDSLLDDQTFGAWGFMWMMSNTTNHTRLAVRTRVNVIGNLHFLGEITSKGTDYNCDYNPYPSR